MIGLLFNIESLIKNNCFKLKGLILKIYLKIHGCKVGKGLRCHTFPRFRIPPYKNYQIGDNVTIGYDITFEVIKTGRLIIGNYVKFTQNILISAGEKISIRDYSMFGEGVSIRDGDHNTYIDKPVAFQLSTYRSVEIGKDVWVGAGCIILKGSNIPDRVIIGANTVVSRNAKLESGKIYTGNPIRKIGERGQENKNNY